MTNTQKQVVRANWKSQVRFYFEGTTLTELKSFLDYTDSTISLLQLLGLKIETGNDAAKGSPTGNWIKILTKIN